MFEQMVDASNKGLPDFTYHVEREIFLFFFTIIDGNFDFQLFKLHGHVGKN